MRPIQLACACVAALAAAACATPQQTSGGPRSPAQMKQDELKQMEQQGQRNDFDKTRIN